MPNNMDGGAGVRLLAIANLWLSAYRDSGLDEREQYLLWAGAMTWPHIARYQEGWRSVW